MTVDAKKSVMAGIAENELIVALMRHATAKTPAQRAKHWADVQRLHKLRQEQNKDG